MSIIVLNYLISMSAVFLQQLLHMIKHWMHFIVNSADVFVLCTPLTQYIAVDVEAPSAGEGKLYRSKDSWFYVQDWCQPRIEVVSATILVCNILYHCHFFLRKQCSPQALSLQIADAYNFEKWTRCELYFFSYMFLLTNFIHFYMMKCVWKHEISRTLLLLWTFAFVRCFNGGVFGSLWCESRRSSNTTKQLQDNVFHSFLDMFNFHIFIVFLPKCVNMALSSLAGLNLHNLHSWPWYLCGPFSWHVAWALWWEAC